MRDETKSILAGLGVAALFLALLFALVFALVAHHSNAIEAESRCRADCPRYGAEFSRTSREAIGGSRQCWCKVKTTEQNDPCVDCVIFDTDHGEVCKQIRRPYEPLRIW